MVISIRSLFSSFHHMSSFRAAVFFPYTICARFVFLREVALSTQLPLLTNSALQQTFACYPPSLIFLSSLMFASGCPRQGKLAISAARILHRSFFTARRLKLSFYHPCFLKTLPRPSFAHLLFPKKFDHFENTSCATTQLESHNPECGRRNKFNFTKASLC